MTPRLGALALALWALAGCAYITGGELDEKRDSLDEDLDGLSAGEDCDDTDPLVQGPKPRPSTMCT